jgi:endonuclease/exonuclease/phosphatase family metal-dependent hydrolase
VPYVKLRHRVTGREVWFMNVHNPADKYGAAAQWRRRAVGIESALASRLSENGTPVVLTGDFNDRETAFCQVTRLSPLVSTSGGSYGGGKCTPPSRMPVDWVFTSRTLTPSNYTIVEGPAVADVTDHFVVYSDLSFGKQAKRH